MRVLVAYATRHGATAGIGARIATVLTERGFEAEARDVGEVESIDQYDAVVLGGAAYLSHWLRPATAFARRHRAELAACPVWLFSSGPLGTDRLAATGEDILEASRPEELEELTELLRPRGEVVFFGAYDPGSPPAGLGERLVRRMPGRSTLLPEGDFRDWVRIDAWAGEIADELGARSTP